MDDGAAGWRNSGCRRNCCCCGDVCSQLPLAQSTVSQHLKVLKEAGLISFRRDGVRSTYVLNRDAFAALQSELEEISALVGVVSSTSMLTGAR